MVNLFGQGRPSGIEDVFRGLEQLVEALVAAAIIASVILGWPVYSIAHDCRKFPLIYRPSQLL